MKSRSCNTGFIRLRPHHLLCIQKFTGHGYDERFTAHMTELVDSLVRDPGRTVKLVSGPDELCSVCPNRIEDCCRSEEKVRRMDCAVLEICGSGIDAKAAWKSLSHTAGSLILSTELFDSVCGDCQWFELCKNTQKGFYDE